MPSSTTRAELIGLLRQAGSAHHRAFAAVNGEDPEWPRWYAEYLSEPLGRLLGVEFAPDTLTTELAALDTEHRSQAPDADWSGYYADRFLARYAGTGRL
jgi:hypothetical protein